MWWADGKKGGVGRVTHGALARVVWAARGGVKGRGWDISHPEATWCKVEDLATTGDEEHMINTSQESYSKSSEYHRSP